MLMKVHQQSHEAKTEIICPVCTGNLHASLRFTKRCLRLVKQYLEFLLVE